MRIEILSQSQRQAIQKEKEVIQASRETQYKREIPYLEQTLSWREGMKYRHSPDSFPINSQEFQLMTNAGKVVGNALEYLSKRIVEFRIDFISDSPGNLFITEIQTDDRGLPAIAIARNARGATQENILPGVIPSFIEAVKSLEEKQFPKMAIIYPEKEYFYYAGFYDFSTMCRTYEIETEIFTIPKEAILDQKDNFLTIKFPTGLIGKIPVDYIWDFSERIKVNSLVQPRINKEILMQAWNDQSPESIRKLREFIPFTYFPQSLEVLKDKNSWVLKPIDGKWSRGVIFGKNLNQREWEKAIAQSRNCLAQRFIEPRIDWFAVRQKNSKYQESPFVARIEGYYFKVRSEWILGDILATLTDDVPVHGKRDCLMIPGKVLLD